MKNLKLDFTIDYITGEKILIQKYKAKLKLVVKRKQNNYFLSEIADFYYKEKYSLNIIQVLEKTYDIPKCPITGDYVSYKLSGHITFGQFSSSCPKDKMSKYVAENNEEYKSFIKKMKTDRVGSGNPMYGKKAWNDGLTKFDDDRVMKISKEMIGTHPTEKTKNKQSESAKKREVHGHTGFKHSEESKQIMREKTIARFKNGKFPQTSSSP